MKLVLVFIGILFIGLLGYSDPPGGKVFGHGERLRKLSLSIRGVNPTIAEYEQLVSLRSESEVSQYFDTKIKEYMNSENYIEKMQQRLEELFRVSLSDEVYLKNSSQSESPLSKNISKFSAMTNLFREIVSENSSWDNLLISKKYTAFGSPFNGNISDFGFLKAVFPDDLPDTGDGVITTIEETESVYNDDYNVKKKEISATSEEQKEVISGAITTSRFFGRYPTTKLNKNRKRAAALFRIFLCDDMRPVVLPSAGEDEKLLSTAFGQTQDGSVSHSNAEQEKRHGSDPQCKSCHYKLDPAGKTFMTSSVVLNPVNSPGGLVFKRADGSLVDIPVSGLGELGAAIVKQPEYLQCQVRHFWNWFIGKDYPLSDKMNQNLALKFDKLGRRPNDFISYILSLPEFYREPVNDLSEITVSHVKPILQKCQKCHESEASVPEFYNLPILSMGYFDTTKKWMSRIARELDLRHNGARASMPPKEAGWGLTDHERKLIAHWIQQGAKDASGTKTIALEAAEKIIPEVEAFKSTKIEPTFDDTFYRYLENHDLFRVLDQYFGTQYGNVYECNQLRQENKNILGVVNPVDGKAVFTSPTPSYVKLVRDCALKYINGHLQAYRYENDEREKGSIDYLPADFLKKNNLDRQTFLSKNWMDLGLEEKKYLVQNLVSQLLPNFVFKTGSGKSEEILLTVEKYIGELNTSKPTEVVSVETSLSWIAMMAVANEDFLTF